MIHGILTGLIWCLLRDLSSAKRVHVYVGFTLMPDLHLHSLRFLETLSYYDRDEGAKGKSYDDSDEDDGDGALGS